MLPVFFDGSEDILDPAPAPRLSYAQNKQVLLDNY